MDSFGDSTWMEGNAACKAGASLADNPYAEALRHYTAWENGWKSARQMQIDANPTDIMWTRPAPADPSTPSITGATA